MKIVFLLFFVALFFSGCVEQVLGEAQACYQKCTEACNLNKEGKLSDEDFEGYSLSRENGSLTLSKKVDSGTLSCSCGC